MWNIPIPIIPNVETFENDISKKFEKFCNLIHMNHNMLLYYNGHCITKEEK